MNIKTRGIVIKRMNYGEADRILTIFTERLGKVKAISRGVRKIKSRLAGNLEPYMITNFELYEGKTFYTVMGALIENEFTNLHNDLKKTAYAYLVGELIDRFLEEGEKSLDAFSLLCNVLSCVENSNKEIFVNSYCLKLLEIVGFKPELYSCVHCKKKILPEEIYWDDKEGGVICSDCQEIYQHGRSISLNTLKLLRYLIQQSFSNINCLKIENKYSEEADEIISDYIKNIIERELKSKKFIKELT